MAGSSPQKAASFNDVSWPCKALLARFTLNTIQHFCPFDALESGGSYAILRPIYFVTGLAIHYREKTLKRKTKYPKKRKTKTKYINSLQEFSLDGIDENSTENRTEKLPEPIAIHQVVEKTKILKQSAMNFSRLVTNMNYEFKHEDVQQVLKMKNVPR